MPFASYQTPPPPSNLPKIRYQEDEDGNVSLFAEGTSGDGHFARLVFGGGHWELHLLGSLPINTGLEIGDDGYVIAHKV